MKKLELLYCLGLFFSCLFSSCENELIEGQFQDTLPPCQEKPEIGEARALINNAYLLEEDLDHEDEIYVHDNGFFHLVIGFSDSEVEDSQYPLGISFNINNPKIGLFDLRTPNEFGFASTFNHHEALTNYGYYEVIKINGGNDIYTTFEDLGGFGEFEITLLDYERQVYSGTFSFTGKQKKRNPESGLLVLDENGEAIIESVEISCGYINEAPFVFEDGSNEAPFFNEFYAEVNGDEFVENPVRAETSVINDSKIINIKAIDGTGRLLRIDIPFSLEVGTFAFEPISDGTKLTAVYNNGETSEGLTPNPGTITITEFDKNRGIIGGAFAFTASDPFELDPTIAEVANGEFKLNFRGTPNTAFYLEALIDGIDYLANGLNFEITSSTILGANVITISTIGELNGGIDLIFPRNIEVGSYDMSSNVLTGNEKVGLYTTRVGLNTSFRSSPGTLTILRYDEATGEIEGAFEFIAKDPLGQDPTEYSVTNGSFLIVLP